jgi:hypothetical protein
MNKIYEKTNISFSEESILFAAGVPTILSSCIKENYIWIQIFGPK